VPLTRSFPRLSYDVTGPESGPRVLLVMGFGMRGRVWKPQIEGLSPRHRVAWFDARGIGQSESSDGGFGMVEMARDAERVLDSLGWSRHVHLVGVSMGGMVALHLALARPRRFASLSLIATTAGGRLTTKLPTVEGLVHFARANLASQATRKKVLLQLLYTPEFVARTEPAVLEARMQEQMGDRAPRHTLRAQLRAVLGHDVTHRLIDISLPTLVVRPGRDILVRPENSDRLARGILGAELLELPDAGHGAVFQCAREVNRALAAHFERASGSMDALRP